MKKVLITLLLLCTFLFADAYKRVVNLKRKGLPINRELVMDPEAWYDTKDHIIDVTIHSNRNRGCTTGITKSLFVKSINSDYLYVKFKNLRLWQED